MLSLSRNKVMWIALAAVVITIAVAVLPAVCQPGGAGGPGGPPGMPGMGGPGMGGPMGMPPAATLVVAEKGVYVMMGPHIYRLDPETLKVLATGELPRPEPPADAAKPATAAK